MLLLDNHAHIYQVNCKTETSLAGMQNFNKIKVTITVQHSDNKIMSVFSPIQHCNLHSFCYSRMAFFYMK